MLLDEVLQEQNTLVVGVSLVAVHRSGVTLELPQGSHLGQTTSQARHLPGQHHLNLGDGIAIHHHLEVATFTPLECPCCKPLSLDSLFLPHLHKLLAAVKRSKLQRQGVVLVCSFQA